MILWIWIKCRRTCMSRPGHTSLQASWLGRSKRRRTMQRTVARWPCECSMYQSPDTHWLLKRHPVSCRIAISYDVWESQVTHSSSRSPLEAFQQNTFKESVVFVGGIEDLTFTSGVLASWVSCWRILKGMLEYQKSFPRYYVQPYLKARLQALWRLLLILLHLDGSTIRP